MKLLVLGDLHLGEDGYAARPNPSWERFDAVLTVGDVAHSRVTVVDGTLRQEKLVGLEEATTFFEHLGELDVPVLTVPGNHDHERHEECIDGATGVRNLHRATVDLGAYHAFGFGSELLDDGPEVRYDPEQVAGIDDPDAWLARTLDRAAGDETEAAAALRGRLEEFDTQFATYTDQYETLTSLTTDSEASAGTIVLTHVPPFNTTLDRVAESVSRIGGRHWGSIALTNLLTEHDISFVACGHIHEADGVDTVAGTPCLNAGYRSAYDVTLENGDVSITDAEPPIE
ncbi:metallophosphoesterase [Haloterrigena sp. H1]|uniref:metallophosphoesterase family protein n=1 Tax=Haloterrigena sp. H1 TaxID=2552943 RepID=UPI00110F0B9F|nr:metallophosphoesterase [Haloterrigena sp. H1]TMT85721.1 metallophosphoesterase [Haloterrigena sp. H1]